MPQPNILVIFGDSIGRLGAQGTMDQAPSIARIAREGILFTDHHGPRGAASEAFIAGKLRSIGNGGLRKEDPTLAEVLKSAGYVTGQFGKYQLGDRNEYLPTVHGFDEWFGHVAHPSGNGSEAPTRGVLHAFSAPIEDPLEDPQFGKVGMQRVMDEGPLTAERLETFDAEVLDKTLDWLVRAVRSGRPFFCWFTASGHRSWANVGKTVAAVDLVRARMREHDGHVGSLLSRLDELRVADDTIVIYTAEDRPMSATDAWHGRDDARLPLMARWPGQIPAGRVSNCEQCHEDLFVTLAAAAGLPHIKESLSRGHEMNGTRYTCQLDGFNNLDHWTGRSADTARHQEGYRH